MRKLGPADYRVMPWKNGGGSTTELLIHPPGATLEGGFLWRLSMAEVGVSGPFSRFPGVDRSLMLLAGDGMVLDHGEHGVQRLVEPFRPVSFSGDWTTEGRLLGGPCRDFNVMSVRGVARHTLEVFRLRAEVTPLPQGRRLLVFGLKGTARVDGVDLEEGRLLELEGAPGRYACSAGTAATVAVVSLTGLHQVGG